MKLFFISLPLIISCCIPLLAQSPRDKLLARRAAGVDGYRNLAAEIQKCFLQLYPGTNAGYFKDLHIRGAKRTSFLYTREGCTVEMELSAENAIEALQNAAENAGISFTQANTDRANQVFQGGLKVKGFGKYRGKVRTFKKQPIKQIKPLPPVRKRTTKEEGVKNFVFEEGRHPKKRNIKDIEEELDIFIESEQKRTPFRKSPYQQKRSFRDPSRNSYRPERWETRGPIRTYEWETHHSAETIEELDSIIEKAIEDALRTWGKRDSFSKKGWKRIRTYTDPETGAQIEEFIRERDSIIIE